MHKNRIGQKKMTSKCKLCLEKEANYNGDICDDCADEIIKEREE